MAEITDLDPTDANNIGRWPENMAFSSVNDAGRADEGILARWFRDWNGSIVASGAAGVYAITSNRTIASYVNNTVMWFRANHTNTGAVTLNLNGIGAKDVIRATGAALTAGDITSGQIVGVYYNSTLDDWVLITPAVQGAASDAATGLIELATLAEILSATSVLLAVTPGRMHNHPGMPKATGRGASAGGVTGTAYKVTSIARNSTGNYTVTLAVTMADTNYWAIATLLGTHSDQSTSITVNITSATTFDVIVRNAGADTLVDADFCFAVYGALA